MLDHTPSRLPYPLKVTKYKLEPVEFDLVIFKLRSLYERYLQYVHLVYFSDKFCTGTASTVYHDLQPTER